MYLNKTLQTLMAKEKTGLFKIIGASETSTEVDIPGQQSYADFYTC